MVRTVSGISFQQHIIGDSDIEQHTPIFRIQRISARNLPLHLAFDRSGGDCYESRGWNVGSGLAQHLWLQHVLLSFFTMGWWDILGALSSFDGIFSGLDDPDTHYLVPRSFRSKPAALRHSALIYPSPYSRSD